MTLTLTERLAVPLPPGYRLRLDGETITNADLVWVLYRAKNRRRLKHPKWSEGLYISDGRRHSYETDTAIATTDPLPGLVHEDFGG